MTGLTRLCFFISLWNFLVMIIIFQIIIFILFFQLGKSTIRRFTVTLLLLIAGIFWLCWYMYTRPVCAYSQYWSCCSYLQHYLNSSETNVRIVVFDNLEYFRLFSGIGNAIWTKTIESAIYEFLITSPEMRRPSYYFVLFRTLMILFMYTHESLDVFYNASKLNLCISPVYHWDFHVVRT